MDTSRQLRRLAGLAISALAFTGCAATMRVSSFSERGIDLGGLSAYLYACRVARNEVLSGRSGGIVATGAVAPGGTLDVVDARTNTLIWRGWARHRMNRMLGNPPRMAKTIQEAVKRTVMRLPPAG